MNNPPTPEERYRAYCGTDATDHVEVGPRWVDTTVTLLGFLAYCAAVAVTTTALLPAHVAAVFAATLGVPAGAYLYHYFA